MTIFMLGNELRALAEGSGLEPQLGFLHRIDYGRPSLALDLLEAFRVPVVDRLVLTLVNRGVLDENDFSRSVAGRELGRVVLNPGSLGRFIEAYEEALTRPRKAAPEGIRREMAREVEKLKRWLAGGSSGDGGFDPWRAAPAGKEEEIAYPRLNSAFNGSGAGYMRRPGNGSALRFSRAYKENHRAAAAPSVPSNSA